MAPQELIGRYRDYKSKTKNLVYWISQTAERCCSLSTIVKSLAVGNKSSAQARTSTPQTGPIEISTQELLELTKAISARRPAVEVPEGVLLIIRDVIAGREGCAEWYSAQALKDDGKVARENNGHRHFIEVRAPGLQILDCG